MEVIVRSWKRRPPPPRLVQASPPTAGVRAGPGPRVLLAFAAMLTLSLVRVWRAIHGHEIFGAEAYLAIAALVVSPGIVWDLVAPRIARWRTRQGADGAPEPPATGAGRSPPGGPDRRSRVVIDLAGRRPRSA
jgi:hypothetical protein